MSTPMVVLSVVIALAAYFTLGGLSVRALDKVDGPMDRTTAQLVLLFWPVGWGIALILAGIWLVDAFLRLVTGREDILE